MTICIALEAMHFLFNNNNNVTTICSHYHYYNCLLCSGKKLKKLRANDFTESPAAIAMGGLDHQRDSGVYLSPKAPQPEQLYENVSFSPRQN